MLPCLNFRYHPRIYLEGLGETHEKLIRDVLKLRYDGITILLSRDSSFRDSNRVPPEVDTGVIA